MMQSGPSMADLMHRRRSSRVCQVDKLRREGYRFSEVLQDDRDNDSEYGQEALAEREYPMWWSSKMLMGHLRVLPENIFWNIFMCMAVQAALVWAIIDYWDLLLDIVYNIFYALHIVALCYNYLKQGTAIHFWVVGFFMMDLASFAHFANPTTSFRLLCYYVRLHRPFRYLFAVADFNLKGSVWGTTAKYTYVFIVLRVTWAFIWLNLDELQGIDKRSERSLPELEYKLNLREGDEEKERASSFLSALYLVNKMFIPIGPSVAPRSDIERIACLIVMLSGILAVTGIAIASLSLVIALYMRPEETFRARYRLIIKDMAMNHIPAVKIERVKTFYRMFWKNQKAVSATALLPTFPPTLPTTIYMDIFFEATQKSKILKDLSYPFLSELAKNMETIHYIPGDAIIKRDSERNAVIYITNGEVEMVTPEDDLTGILRFSKGTVLTPCGVATASGLGRAHLEVRAATFCTAHVLRSRKLWKIAVKYGKNDESTAMILDGFYDHIEKVKRNHFAKKQVALEKASYKSSVLHFKRCVVALKEAKNVDGTMLMPRTDYFMNIAGAYVLRNCSDATLTDESDAICLRSTFPCILQPSSSLIFAWNLIVTFIVFIVCLIYPYYFVFKKSVPLEFRFFNYMVTFVYFVDLIVHLSTGENVEQGVAISFLNTATEQMMNKWFVLDVLATLPIFQFVGTGHFSGINKLLKVAKGFRVLKELENVFVYRSNVVRFLSYTFMLIIACYFIASLQQGFMCFQYEYCIVSNFTHSPHWENKPLDEETVQHRVTFSLYWAMAMIMFTSHKETWSSDNWQNVIATMMILEVCIVIRVFMESVYSATIIVTAFLRDDFDSTISSVRTFLERNQIEPKLQQRFITYLELCWYTDKAYSISNKKKSIYHDLPGHVYTNILVTKRNRFLFQIPFFKYVTKEDMEDLAAHARLFYTSPNEILQNTGDICNELYIVKQGYLEMICPITKNMRILSSKARFGLLTCLFRIPAFYTVRAITHVQMFAISRKHLLKVICKPNFIDTMEFIRKQPVPLIFVVSKLCVKANPCMIEENKEYNAVTNRLAPFTSYEPIPKVDNLMRFKLPRKHEPDHAFLQPFFRLGFFSVFRYVFPRYTIRPDGSYIVVYECIHAVCAFLAATLSPCYEYMSLQFTSLVYISRLLDLLSYFDIAQRMLIGYFNEQGLLIYHPASTAAHYIKGAFITDIFATLPLEYLEPVVKNGDKFRVTRLSQILICNRLAQLYRLPGAMVVLDQYIERKDVLIVLKAVPLFMVLINVMTCFMVLHTVDILYNNKGEWWITPYKDKGGSWVELFQNTVRFNITSSPFNIQLATYFWVSFEATTTGYNTFNPSNFQIMRILLIGLICGTMMITYFSVVIISIRSNVNRALAEYQENLRDIGAYMKREKLDAELQQDVLTHYEYSWDKMGGIDYRQVFKLCDQITLRTDAILHIYGPTFANCPILLQSDASLLRTLGRAVHSAYFSRGQVIILSNDVIEDMYFVDYGDVTISEDNEERGTTVKLSRGSIFGNLDGQATIRCPLTVTASSKIHLLMLNSIAFHDIITDYPTVAKLMQHHRSTPTANFILGLSADPFRRKERQNTPMVVTKNRGLVKYLFFQDIYVENYFILVSLACVYLDMYNAGFQDNTWPMVFALYALDLGFTLKVALKLSLPLLVGWDIKSMIVSVKKEYLNCEFRYDLASCVPIELLCFVSKQYRWTIFSWLRLNRVFRIATVHKSLYRHEERITVNLTLMTIVSVFIWFTLFVHGVSCLWFFIGTMEDFKQPNSSWMWKDDGSSWCNNKYLCSIYFVLTTFTQNGVGDIMPKKHSEVMFVITLEIISTMVYMIYVGEFSNIIQYQSFRCFSFYTKYLELQEFLRNNRVSRNLAGLVNRYCVHLWRESRGKQAPSFLLNAPHAMRLQIMSAAYLHHLTRHHVFERCEPAFLRQLAGCLKLYSYNEGMYVVKSNEITDSMYLIHKGRVRELLMNGNEINQITRVYPAGSYFGVVQGLTPNTPYARTYQTVSNAQVLTLCRDDWLYLMEHFPNSRDEINKHMRANISRLGKGSVAGSIIWPLPINALKAKVTELSDKASQAYLPPPPVPVSQIDALRPRDGVSFIPMEKSNEQLSEEQGQNYQWPTIREEDEEDEEMIEQEQTFKWPIRHEDSAYLFASKESSKDPDDSLEKAASDVSVASEKEKEMMSMNISKPKLTEDADKEMMSMDISKPKLTEDAEKEMMSMDISKPKLTEDAEKEMMSMDISKPKLTEDAEKEMMSMDISKPKLTEDAEKEMISVDISKSKTNADAEKEIETTEVDLQSKREQPESDMTKSAVPTESLSEEKRDQGTSTSRVPRKSLRLRYDEGKDEETEDETEDKKDDKPK